MKNPGADSRVLLSFAKENRKHSTDAEFVLWEKLRARSLGVKFRRQHIIGEYIVDFVCVSHRFYIKIDGFHHLQGKQLEYDCRRKQYLENLGFTELRFTNEEILKDLNSVITRISNYIVKELPLK